jgi:hypothetical protein
MLMQHLEQYLELVSVFKKSSKNFILFLSLKRQLMYRLRKIYSSHGPLPLNLKNKLPSFRWNGLLPPKPLLHTQAEPLPATFREERPRESKGRLGHWLHDGDAL